LIARAASGVGSRISSTPPSAAAVATVAAKSWSSSVAARPPGTAMLPGDRYDRQSLRIVLLHDRVDLRGHIFFVKRIACPSVTGRLTPLPLSP